MVIKNGCSLKAPDYSQWAPSHSMEAQVCPLRVQIRPLRVPSCPLQVRTHTTVLWISFNQYDKDMLNWLTAKWPNYWDHICWGASHTLFTINCKLYIIQCMLVIVYGIHCKLPIIACIFDTVYFNLIFSMERKWGWQSECNWLGTPSRLTSGLGSKVHGSVVYGSVVPGSVVHGSEVHTSVLEIRFSGCSYVCPACVMPLWKYCYFLYVWCFLTHILANNSNNNNSCK